MTTIAHMTLKELDDMIEAKIDARLTRMLGDFEWSDPADEDRSWEESRAAVKRARRPLPPGARSSVELLREDRDR